MEEEEKKEIFPILEIILRDRTIFIEKVGSKTLLSLEHYNLNLMPYIYVGEKKLLRLLSIIVRGFDEDNLSSNPFKNERASLESLSSVEEEILSKLSEKISKGWSLRVYSKDGDIRVSLSLLEIKGPKAQKKEIKLNKMGLREALKEALTEVT
jgi:hypothetical protein